MFMSNVFSETKKTWMIFTQPTLIGPIFTEHMKKFLKNWQGRGKDEFTTKLTHVYKRGLLANPMMIKYEYISEHITTII